VRIVFLALVLTAVLSVLPAGVASAREAFVCATNNGSRTTNELEDEVRVAGYSGPWDRVSVAAAYGRATGGAVMCKPPNGRVAVVLVGGYGSDLAFSIGQFSALRQALSDRDPDVLLVHYSYTGTSFSGCTATPSPYGPADTAQDIEVSKALLRETLAALHAACDLERIAIVGHSLGGLIAFEAAEGLPEPAISDLVTVDSPLGGVPERIIQTCIGIGYCTDGSVVNYLADLYANAPAVEHTNAARAAELASAGTRVSAWGNQSDCFYNLSLCTSVARVLVGAADGRETQWLGIPRWVRKDYPVIRSLSSIGSSHTAILVGSANELAEELLG
jgi:pimeloyl-ACP methyl ester carboxylesterase